MPAVRHCSRIDTFELKLQMERRLGSQKADKYFNLLTRFLSLKLGKSEFNKLCIRLIGRENLRHHNELIKAIIKNSIVSKTPPSKDPTTNLQSICRDVFPQSPKKGRTPVHRERKYKDRPSPLNGKTHIADDLVQEQEQENHIIHRRIPITPPFGIQIHSKETRKASSSFYTETCHYNGQLPPTISLMNRLNHKLKLEGLEISMDCVNLLNNGLDSYLKRVIKPSLESSKSKKTSMLDFRVATEINPKILGEDWPIKLEKIASISE